MKWNICITGIPEREEGQQWIKSLYEEIMVENFPNLVKEKDTSSGGPEIPKQNHPNRLTLRHIITKMTKVKDKGRSLKTPRERQKHFMWEGISMKYLKWWKAMAYNHDYFTQWGCNLKLKKK